MKTCSQCGRSYPDAQLLCAACNRPLPKGEAADVNTVGHINYLLGELPQWVMAGWLDPRQARQLADKYERRRGEILAGGMVQPAWTAARRAARAVRPDAPPAPHRHAEHSHPVTRRRWRRSARTGRWRTGC